MRPCNRVPPNREQTLAVVRASVRREALATSDGRRINDYIDGHAILGDPTGLAGCCELVCERVLQLKPTGVVGEVSAACGLVSGVVLRAQQQGVHLLGRYLRKEEKHYGVTGLLNTDMPAGSLVVLDDVTGVGNSAVRAVQTLQAVGHEILAAIVILDRGEGAAARLGDIGVELSWLFDLGDVVDLGGQ